jgi:hypothetical protein
MNSLSVDGGSYTPMVYCAPSAGSRLSLIPICLSKDRIAIRGLYSRPSLSEDSDCRAPALSARVLPGMERLAVVIVLDKVLKTC